MSKSEWVKEVIDILEIKQFYGTLSINFNAGEAKDVKLDHRFNGVNFERVKGQPKETVDLIKL